MKKPGSAPSQRTKSGGQRTKSGGQRTKSSKSGRTDSNNSNASSEREILMLKREEDVEYRDVEFKEIMEYY